VPQSPTVALNTWAAQHHIPTRYILLNEQFLPPSPNFSWSHPHIIFFYRLYFGHDLYFDGHGSSHQQARINCACHALNFIQQNQLSITLSTPPSQVNFPNHKKKHIFKKSLLDAIKTSYISDVRTCKTTWSIRSN
jgi:hypothetical protein